VPHLKYFEINTLNSLGHWVFEIKSKYKIIGLVAVELIELM